MNPAPPLVCGTLLAVMMAAGVSHYWSIENFIESYPTVPVIRVIPISPTAPTETDNQPASSEPEDLAATPPEPQTGAGKEFFESLIMEMRNLRNENLALTDQIAETNRDVMKMQFQIDTHSESFRPLPSQERQDTTYGNDDDFSSGVLPPRAEPVLLTE